MPRTLRARWYLPLIAAALAFLVHGAIVYHLTPRRHEAKVGIELGVSSETPPPVVQFEAQNVRVPVDDELDEVLDDAARWIASAGAASPGSDDSSNLPPEVLQAIQSREGESLARGEAAAAALRASTSLSASTGPGGLLVEVRGRAATPAGATLRAWAAAQAAAARLGAAIEEGLHRRLERSQARLETLEQEAEAVAAERDEFARQTGFVDVARREDLLQSSIVEMEGRIHELEARRLQVARRLRESGSVFGSGPGAGSRPAEPEGAADAGRRQAMARELTQARLEYEVQSVRNSERHPRMVKLAARIRELEERLARLSPEPVAPTNGPEDRGAGLARLYRELTVELDTLETTRKGLVQEFEHLKRIEPEADRLERQVERARDRLRPVRDEVEELEWVLSGASGFVRPRVLGGPVEVDRLARAAPWIWLSTLGGLGLGLALAWLGAERARRRTRLAELHRSMRLPVLAAVPRMSRRARSDPLAPNRPGVRERIDAAASVIRRVSEDLEARVIAVASARDGDGKTTLSVHLAAALARRGFEVALVDGDLSRPRLHEVLGLLNELGLTSLLESVVVEQEVIENGEAVDEVRHLDPRDREAVEFVLQAAVFENLQVLTGGPLSAVSDVAVHGVPMQRLLKTLAEMVDYVIVDTPSVQNGGEALELVGLADACLLVVGPGLQGATEALWARQLIENVQPGVLGTILNRWVQRGESDHRLAGLTESGNRPVEIEVPA